jgi:hypothetical protein
MLSDQPVSVSVSGSAANLPAKPKPHQKSEPKLVVNGKNRAAIDAMVWEGLTRKAAAEKAGLKDHALYVALTKPHVKAYYLAQLDVLRTSERARNIHTLAEVRDQTSNQMARVQAVKALEQLSDDPVGSAAQSQSPGVVVQIITSAPLIQHQRHIDANPLITLDGVHHDE